MGRGLRRAVTSPALVTGLRVGDDAVGVGLGRDVPEEAGGAGRGAAEQRRPCLLGFLDPEVPSLQRFRPGRIWPPPRWRGPALFGFGPTRRWIESAWHIPILNEQTRPATGNTCHRSDRLRDGEGPRAGTRRPGWFRWPPQHLPGWRNRTVSSTGNHSRCRNPTGC